MSYVVPGFALIHSARVIRTERAGERNDQGERVALEVPGPWFPARLMRRRPSSKGAADPGGLQRATRPWALLWGDEDDSGDPLDPPRAADLVEVLTDDQPAQRFTIDGPPEAFDGGDGPFGGQADLSEVLAPAAASP